MDKDIKIKKIQENIYKIEKTGKMLVPVIILASQSILEKIKEDKTLDQAVNMAMMPGVVKNIIVLPDAHQGYGACIGGVSAYDIETGVVSPGQIGYDQNCGIRLLTTSIDKENFLAKRNEVINQIYRDVPAGVGYEGDIKLSDQDLDIILEKGAKWALEKNLALKEDLEKTEDSGCIENADPPKVSKKAKSRGRHQQGTLGSGNHFLEIQEVETIYDPEIAKAFNINNIGQIVIMIHSGSRGLGHQNASDYIQAMEKTLGYSHLPDRELVCAPIKSQLGQDFIKSMNAAANFAFCNRQIMAHLTRKAIQRYFPKVKIEQVYDVAHNIAKFESHIIDGKEKTLCVHRKGATRSFGPGRKELPKCYQKTGQPIILPGSMGTFSYLLQGSKKAEELSFASTAHGAGRMHSRSYALKNITKESIQKNLASKNITIKTRSIKGIVEEAPEVYKDINEVAKVSHELGIGNLVARMKPIAVVKG